MDQQDLEAIAEVLARGTNVLVLSDEIYAELTYGLDRHVSIASLPGMWERTIVVNGFSKSYSMTGWRLGYAAGPEPIIKVMTKIHQSCIMSAPTTSQYAAIVALRSCDDEIEMMRDEYNRRRRYVVKAPQRSGVDLLRAKGGVLCVPQHPVQRPEEQRILRTAAQGTGGGHRPRRRLRRVRRRVCPHQLRATASITWRPPCAASAASCRTTAGWPGRRCESLTAPGNPIFPSFKEESLCRPPQDCDRPGPPPS